MPPGRSSNWDVRNVVLAALAPGFVIQSYLLNQPILFGNFDKSIVSATSKENDAGSNQNKCSTAESLYCFREECLNVESFNCPCLCGLPEWVWFLQEKKYFSQFGEDGITLGIVDHLSVEQKYFVEFGTQNATECNTRILRDLHGWTGLLMDGGDYPDPLIRQEIIMPDNVVSLFEKYNVPKEFDFWSEDTDYADWYLVRNVLDAGYRPRAIVVEVNSNFNRDDLAGVVHAPPPGEVRFWGKTGGYAPNYNGANPLAFRYLFNKHGYVMIYCTKKGGINCFAVRADFLGLEPTNHTGIAKVQQCVWDKRVMGMPKKHHRKDQNNETYHVVNEDGDIIEGLEYVPSFMKK